MMIEYDKTLFGILYALSRTWFLQADSVHSSLELHKARGCLIRRVGVVESDTSVSALHSHLIPAVNKLHIRLSTTSQNL